MHHHAVVIHSVSYDHYYNYCAIETLHSIGNSDNVDISTLTICAQVINIMCVCILQFKWFIMVSPCA